MTLSKLNKSIINCQLCSRLVVFREKIARENAENILKKLDDFKIVFQKEADEKNQLYGSVSTKEIHSFLLEKDIKINIDDIQINEPIKSIGEHTISISPYDNLSKNLKIFVDKIKEI